MSTLDHITRAASGPGRDTTGDVTVSVIIPVYNRTGLLRRAVGSVLAQTHQNFEILIVDDASSIDIAAVVDGFADPRVRLLRNDENRGGGYSRARGAKEARGDFCAFLDSDDWWMPDKLRRQLAAARTMPGGRYAVLSRTYIVNNGRRFLVPKTTLPPGMAVAEYLYCHQGLTHTSSILLPTPLAQEVTFDPTLRVNQETDYLIRLQQAGADFLHLEEPLTFFDGTPRRDRVSYNPALINLSEAWFRRVSPQWPPLARRGYYICDLTLRAANAGRRWRAVGYFFKGVHPSFGLYNQLRIFVYALCLGEPPQVLVRLAAALRKRPDDPGAPDRRNNLPPNVLQSVAGLNEARRGAQPNRGLSG